MKSKIYVYSFSAIVVVPIVERCGERIVLIIGGLLQFIGCFAAGLMTSFPFLFLFIGIIWGKLHCN